MPAISNVSTGRPSQGATGSPVLCPRRARRSNRAGVRLLLAPIELLRLRCDRFTSHFHRSLVDCRICRDRGFERRASPARTSVLAWSSMLLVFSRIRGLPAQQKPRARRSERILVGLGRRPPRHRPLGHGRDQARDHGRYRARRSGVIPARGSDLRGSPLIVAEESPRPASLVKQPLHLRARYSRCIWWAIGVDVSCTLREILASDASAERPRRGRLIAQLSPPPAGRHAFVATVDSQASPTQSLIWHNSKGSWNR